MKRWAWLLSILTVFFVSPSSPEAAGKSAKSGGTLTGHLTVTAQARPVPHPAPQGHDEYGYGAPSQPTETHTLPEQVVIYLKGVKGHFEPPAKHLQLDQQYLQFTRRVLPVLKGTTVDFTNHDPVYHNVFTNSQLNKFDLGRKRKGEKSSVKMTHSEVPIKVYCEIHSKMKSYVLVLDNPFFTTVGPDQTFEVKGIPPGTYTMVAWHDYWAPVEQKVKIKKGKTTVADVTLDKVQN
jgi:plastocyanin